MGGGGAGGSFTARRENRRDAAKRLLKASSVSLLVPHALSHKCSSSGHMPGAARAACQGQMDMPATVDRPGPHTHAHCRLKSRCRQIGRSCVQCCIPGCNSQVLKPWVPKMGCPSSKRHRQRLSLHTVAGEVMVLKGALVLMKPPDGGREARPRGATAAVEQHARAPRRGTVSDTVMTHARRWHTLSQSQVILTAEDAVYSFDRRCLPRSILLLAPAELKSASRCNQCSKLAAQPRASNMLAGSGLQRASGTSQGQSRCCGDEAKRDLGARSVSLLAPPSLHTDACPRMTRLPAASALRSHPSPCVGEAA